MDFLTGNFWPIMDFYITVCSERIASIQQYLWSEILEFLPLRIGSLSFNLFLVINELDRVGFKNVDKIVIVDQLTLKNVRAIFDTLFKKIVLQIDGCWRFWLRDHACPGVDPVRGVDRAGGDHPDLHPGCLPGALQRTCRLGHRARSAAGYRRNVFW